MAEFHGITVVCFSYSILYGDDVLEFLAHLFEEAIVEWLQESQVVVGDAQRLAFRLQFGDSLGCIVSDRTDGKNGYIGAVFQLSAGTGLDFLHLVAPIYKHTAATRITDHVASVVWQLG